MRLLKTLPIYALVFGGMAVFTSQSAKAQDHHHHHHHHGVTAQIVTPRYVPQVRIVVPTHSHGHTSHAHSHARSHSHVTVLPRIYPQPVYRVQPRVYLQGSSSRVVTHHNHGSHSHHHHH